MSKKKFLKLLCFGLVIHTIYITKSLDNKSEDLDNSDSLKKKLYNLGAENYYSINELFEKLEIIPDNYYIPIESSGGMPRIQQVTFPNGRKLVHLTIEDNNNVISVKQMKEFIIKKKDIHPEIKENLELVFKLKKHFLNEYHNLYAILAETSDTERNEKINLWTNISDVELNFLAYLYDRNNFSIPQKDGKKNGWIHLSSNIALKGGNIKFDQLGHIFVSLEDGTVLQVVEYQPKNEDVNPFLFISFLGRSLEQKDGSLLNLIRSQKARDILERVSVNSKVEIQALIKSKISCSKDESKYLGDNYKKYINKVFGDSIDHLSIDSNENRSSVFDKLNIKVNLQKFNEIYNDKKDNNQI